MKTTVPYVIRKFFLKRTSSEELQTFAYHPWILRSLLHVIGDLPTVFWTFVSNEVIWNHAAATCLPWRKTSYRRKNFPFLRALCSRTFRCKEKEPSRKCYALHFGAIIGTEGNIKLRPDSNLITSMRQVNSGSETISRSTVELTLIRCGRNAAYEAGLCNGH